MIYDIVLCDIVPKMDACHMLHGQPWFDKKTIHYWYSDTYTFGSLIKWFLLKPMHEQIASKSAKGDSSIAMCWIDGKN